MNAVLQDSANASARLDTGWSPSALWNTFPSTVTVGGHDAGDEGLRPAWNSAVEVRILNVDPGGNPPSRAASNASAEGRLADARIWSLSTETATRATASPDVCGDDAACAGPRVARAAS